MRPEIIFGIVTILPLVSYAQRRSVWFDKLPNEKLEGVPRFIRDNEKNFINFKNFLISAFGRSGTDNIMQEAVKRQRAQKHFNESVPFFCDVSSGRSKERPTSVHALRPGDIDIIAAIGDSLTAGNGAFALSNQHLFVENRGVCAMIGGQGNWRKFLTIPNILKVYNPKLIGYATGDSFTHHQQSQFNVAEPGAMIQDLPHMVKELVKRIKKDPRVDIKNDWKLVNLLIGGNNICIDFCYVQNLTETFEEQRRILTHVFQVLRDNLPRTIVNFLHTPNVKALTDCGSVPFNCEILHKLECPCLFGLQFQSKRKEFFKTVKEWQRVDEEVARDEQFRTKEDFAIVLQNFTRELSLPRKRDSTGNVVCDLTYVSHDCFHFSQKGYARATNALWNNMLEPVGWKSHDWPTEFQKFLCPTERSPYIYTWKNSQ